MLVSSPRVLKFWLRSLLRSIDALAQCLLTAYTHLSRLGGSARRKIGNFGPATSSPQLQPPAPTPASGDAGGTTSTTPLKPEAPQLQVNGATQQPYKGHRLCCARRRHH